MSEEEFLELGVGDLVPAFLEALPMSLESKHRIARRDRAPIDRRRRGRIRGVEEIGFLNAERACDSCNVPVLGPSTFLFYTANHFNVDPRFFREVSLSRSSAQPLNIRG